MYVCFLIRGGLGLWGVWERGWGGWILGGKENVGWSLEEIVEHIVCFELYFSLSRGGQHN